MVEPLTEVAQRLVLPGLELVPPNTVVPLETNSTFVESYLVGLNTEMGRELLWREYPADLRATYFDRFWDASSSPGRPPDIDDLATWGDRAARGRRRPTRTSCCWCAASCCAATPTRSSTR